MICPCCGQEVTPKGRLQAFAARRQSAPLTGGVLRVLMAARTPIPLRDLVSAVYANDPSGGPDSADQCVRIAIHRLRPQLRDIGWTIQRHGWSGYALQPTRVAA
jgi:hypothetical protein